MTEEINPIYSGDPRDFHWVGFGSGSGTNLRECARVIKPSLIFSDRPSARLLRLEELAEVPQVTLNGYKYCGSWKIAEGNSGAEQEYRLRSIEFNRRILEKLKTFERDSEVTIDLIVLGGYMRLIMDPLLETYRDRIINVHPADLSVLDGDYSRRFIGENAVYDAINAGEESTTSSVIMVDEGEDHGEILVQGPELAVWHEFIHGTPQERAEALREYADSHQSLQKVRSDWPALTTTLKLISEGRISLGTKKEVNGEWRRVHIDGEPMGYEGYQLTA